MPYKTDRLLAAPKGRELPHAPMRAKGRYRLKGSTIIRGVNGIGSVVYEPSEQFAYWFAIPKGGWAAPNAFRKFSSPVAAAFSIIHEHQKQGGDE